MKTRIYLFALIACIFMGCEMAEVVEWGDDCPGSNSEGELSYIGDESCTKSNSTSCRIEDKTYDQQNRVDNDIKHSVFYGGYLIKSAYE